VSKPDAPTDSWGACQPENLLAPLVCKPRLVCAHKKPAAREMQQVGSNIGVKCDQRKRLAKPCLETIELRSIASESRRGFSEYLAAY